MLPVSLDCALFLLEKQNKNKAQNRENGNSG
jgi:hypothetical protein